MSATRTPPGWPAEIPPPESPGWEHVAVGWLLDQCPADYRGYDAWRRHPVALAWIARRHVEGEVEVMREAYRRARVELADHLAPEALEDVRSALEHEGLRLRAVAHAAALVADAMEGRRYVPRL